MHGFNSKVKDRNVFVNTRIKFIKLLKSRVHCFSMQVVMNKSFLLNPEKNFGVDSSCRFRKNAPLIPKNDVTEPKARLL